VARKAKEIESAGYSVRKATGDMQVSSGIVRRPWTSERRSRDLSGGLVEEDRETECTASYIYGEMRYILRGYVRGLGLQSEIEDVIQESFYRLLLQLRRRDRVENIRAWLFQVAYNISMDIHRRRSGACMLQLEEAGQLQMHADHRSNPEWMYSQKEKVGQIRIAMSRLTKRQLRSVRLRIRGLSYREIAANLDVSEQRATYLVKRALERLGEVS
jgi:RNA polymerase sigma factor (sigma-70 family)